jgi:8-oxo-dGTP diphosphatase
VVSRIEVAVKALIVRRGRLLLLRRHPGARPAPGGWDTPGGRLRFGETLEAALRREVREELGGAVSLDIRQVLNAWTFAKDRRTQLVGITFLCGLRGQPEAADLEHTSLQWMAPSRALTEPDVSEALRETIRACQRLPARRAPARP